jgi:hypothetical protein
MTFFIYLIDINIYITSHELQGKNDVCHKRGKA